MTHQRVSLARTLVGSIESITGACVSYDPKPIDTSNVKLTPQILELREVLARNAHEIWSRQRFKDGWRFGAQRDDPRKEHPCLIPYEQLPESEKEYDRLAAMETLKTIVGLGYEIRKSKAS